MALNFPSAPVVGQVYQAEGMSFVWNGTLWYVLDAFPWAAPGAAEGVMTPAATKAALDAVPQGGSFNIGFPRDLTASRAIGTNYQNPRANVPMLIAASFSDRDDTSNAELRVGPTNANPPTIVLGQAWANRGTGPSENTIIGVVPAGWWYRLHLVARRPSVTAWWEWRDTP
jgi:hypothetical protein